jgi:CelD/BcsL family acetyltransferase involved in cellulose biosynthesis
MLIGQRADTFAEYLDFIVERGREAEVTSAFCDFLHREVAAEWDFIFFERILTTSPNLSTLKRKTRPLHLVALRDRQLKAPHVVLGGSWPEFMAQKSRNFRNQWNNSWNRLQAEGEVKFLFAGSDVPLSAALAELTRLHRERWEEDSASFRTEDYLKFHEQLCARLHANGWLLLLLLSVNGRNVAVRYDYRYAGKLWCMQGGWSPEYASKRVGTLLTGKVIEWGFEHGLREYDFLGGDSDYKRRWANGERLMTNLTAGNTNTVRGRLWKWNRALEDVARRVKRTLGTKPTRSPKRMWRRPATPLTGRPEEGARADGP